jgi:hypothetical protein
LTEVKRWSEPTTHAAETTRISAEEYLAGEEASEFRHEWIAEEGGVAMHVLARQM